MSVSDFRGTVRFEVVSRVGEGAVGVVFDAHDRERQTRVALKALHSPTAETIRLLKNEFRAVQDLAHPNLVHLGELFEERGQWFFTMEFVEGTNFIAYVRSGSTFDEPRLRAALLQLALGICALHGAGKVHRDVKPMNIVVTPQGRVVLLDFGIARDVARGRAFASREDDQGPVGTVAYMAPEQAASEAVGPAADWYAVGVLLFEALTGRLPFDGAWHEVLEKKLAEAPCAPSAIASGVPADLNALCIALLRQDPATRPTDSEMLRALGSTEAPASSPGPASDFFVGRHGELAVFRKALRDVTEREEPVTVLVRGESGVGKSALVREFARQALEKDGSLLELFGKCYERESLPFKAFDTIVDGLATHLESLSHVARAKLFPENVGLLGRIFPALAALVGERKGAIPATPGSPNELRQRAFLVLRELFTRLAETRRLVLITEDLQWADADSLALLAELVRPPGAPALLLIATERVSTDSHSDLFLAAPIPGDVRNVDVMKLGGPDARALTLGLLRLAGRDDADESAQIRSIVDEADGHPLFIDELVRQRSVRGASEAPLRLDDALWWRVRQLDAGAQDVLSLIAIAGGPVPQQLAQDVAGTAGAEMLTIVASLRAAHLARTSGGRGEDSIEPYHDRVRESVLANLDADTRAAWHRRLASALETTEVVDAEALAVHWQGGGDLLRAARYAARAADEAAESLAFDHAARLYGIAISNGTFTTSEAHALKAKRADALTNAGRLTESAETQVALAEGADDEPSALDLRRRAAEQFLCSGHFERGIELLRGVLARTGVYFPRSPLVVILALLMARAALRIRGLAFRERAAVTVASAALVKIDAASSAGAAFSMSDSIRGSYFQTRTLLFALRAGEPTRVLRAMMMETCFSGVGGTATHARTARLMAAVDALATRVETGEAFARAEMARGYMHYMVGDWRRAADALGRSERLYVDTTRGLSFYLATTRTMLYRSLVYLGDVQGIAAHVPRVLRDSERQGDLYMTTNIRTSPTLFLALVRGEPERAESELREVESHLAPNVFHLQHYFHLIARGQLDLYRGHARPALSRLAHTFPALKRGMILRVQVIRIATLEHRARIAIAAALEAHPADPGMLASAERDARALENIPTPWAAANALAIYALLDAARGDIDQACERFGKVATAFDGLAMKVHAASARLRCGELQAGEGGEALRRSAISELSALGVADPARLVDVYAPTHRLGAATRDEAANTATHRPSPSGVASGFARREEAGRGSRSSRSPKPPFCPRCTAPAYAVICRESFPAWGRRALPSASWRHARGFARRRASTGSVDVEDAARSRGRLLHRSELGDPSTPSATPQRLRSQGVLAPEARAPARSASADHEGRSPRRRRCPERRSTGCGRRPRVRKADRVRRCRVGIRSRGSARRSLGVAA